MGGFLSTYVTPMAAVYLFWYLGQMLLSTNNNWPAVECNLRRA